MSKVRKALLAALAAGAASVITGFNDGNLTNAEIGVAVAAAVVAGLAVWRVPNAPKAQ